VKTLFLNLETRAKGTAHAPATLGQLSPIHLTVDCTQLPNPHKHFPNSTGCDDAVQTWLMQQPTVMPLLKRTVNDIADKLTVEAERADPLPVNVAFTCFGGRHRSVALAHMVSLHLLAESQLWVHPVVTKLYLTSLKEPSRV